MDGLCIIQVKVLVDWQSMYAQYVCVGYICPARVELQIDIMLEIFRDIQILQESFLHINHSVGTIPTKCLIFVTGPAKINHVSANYT